MENDLIYIGMEYVWFFLYILNRSLILTICFRILIPSGDYKLECTYLVELMNVGLD